MTSECRNCEAIALEIREAYREARESKDHEFKYGEFPAKRLFIASRCNEIA